MAAAILGATAAQAQDHSWRPSRVPSNANAQPLPSQASGLRAARPVQQAAETENLGSGVALRWKTTSSRTGNNTSTIAAASHGQSEITAQAAFGQGGSTLASAFEEPQRASGREPVRVAASTGANPLRSESQVRLANYQQPGSQQPGGLPDPFGNDAAPQDSGTQPSLPPLPSDLPDLSDPLAAPEPAPSPDQTQGRLNPFPTPQDPPREAPRSQDPSPFDRDLAPQAADPDSILQREQLDAPSRRNPTANSISCNEQRNRARNLPLKNIDLDVSPTYGEGLRSVKKDTELERREFAASSEIRQWSDYTGAILATGRLVDLRDDRVVIDVDGMERTIPFRDLSDVDVAYVGESWNIPATCGTGYERYEGRNFIASTVQWTASGLCHKPLYFEQVQLERYGHEAGPVIQPLVSTAHFFGNIAVMPYKMGIHPPGECQYSLGYIRPGNCAPYMMQPIPWSLRGAVAQAGFVSGAAALIP